MQGPYSDTKTIGFGFEHIKVYKIVSFFNFINAVLYYISLIYIHKNAAFTFIAFILGEL
jgi:hypothetical protein